MRISVVIRTYNEQRYLEDLLKGILAQAYDRDSVEIIIVDSGSTDQTLEIASRYPTRIVHIAKDEFSFGRSLNLGCQAARGEALVFVSGHCVPASDRWLAELVAPFQDERIAYTYGAQLGTASSRFSETQIFQKYYPGTSKIPQEGFFCNNANAALRRSVWEEHPFDEELTGLEDMHLGKRLVAAGKSIAYVATAPVHHIHHETWSQVRRRFEREAIALQHIMPEVHIDVSDVLRYFLSAVFLDMSVAIQMRSWSRHFVEIVIYRFLQFTGSYRGNHYHRTMSRRTKESYFFPR